MTAFAAEQTEESLGLGHIGICDSGDVELEPQRSSSIDVVELGPLGALVIDADVVVDVDRHLLVLAEDRARASSAAAVVRVQ